MKILGFAVIVLGLLLILVMPPRPLDLYTLIAGVLILVVGIGVTALGFYQKKQRRGN